MFWWYTTLKHGLSRSTTTKDVHISITAIQLGLWDLGLWQLSLKWVENFNSLIIIINFLSVSNVAVKCKSGGAKRNNTLCATSCVNVLLELNYCITSNQDRYCEVRHSFVWRQHILQKSVQLGSCSSRHPTNIRTPGNSVLMQLHENRGNSALMQLHENRGVYTPSIHQMSRYRPDTT